MLCKGCKHYDPEKDVCLIVKGFICDADECSGYEPKETIEHPAKTNADKLREVFGSRGEKIAYCMGFQFGLWDKWFAAPYEEPKEDA